MTGQIASIMKGESRVAAGAARLRVTVSPAVLHWAIERSGRTLEQIQNRFPQINKWERGESKPTYRQLQDVAAYLYVRLPYLLRSEPPVEELPLPDFRIGGALVQRRPSPNLLEMIYLCQQRQTWYREYAIDRDLEPVAFVGSTRLTSDPIPVASQLQSELGFEMQDRRSYGSWEAALKGIVEQVEDAGALVMRSGVVGSNTHRPLDPDEFRGFALADTYAPLIFINTADTKAAQMFTLAHEIAHLTLGDTGVSDASPRIVANTQRERWCNAVAAELLVPAKELDRHSLQGFELKEDLIALAKIFRVSTLVILRRLLDTGRLSKEQFDSEYDRERARVLSFKAQSNGGDFYNTVPVRVSRRFATAIVEDTIEGGTAYRDATKLLGFKSLAAFDELGQQLGVTT